MLPATIYGLIRDAGCNAASNQLKPYDARLMRCCPISTQINHVANDDAECSAPVELARSSNNLTDELRTRPARLPCIEGLRSSLDTDLTRYLFEFYSVTAVTLSCVHCGVGTGHEGI